MNSKKFSTVSIALSTILILSFYNNCAKKTDISEYTSTQSSFSQPCGQGGFVQGAECTFIRPQMYHADSISYFRIWGSDFYIESKGYSNASMVNANQFCIQQLGSSSRALFYSTDNLSPGDAGEDESFYLTYNSSASRWVLEASGSTNRDYALLTEVRCQL